MSLSFDILIFFIQDEYPVKVVIEYKQHPHKKDYDNHIHIHKVSFSI